MFKIKGVDNLERLNSKGQTEEEFLEQYDSDKYEKPSVAVDLLIFSVAEKLRILLIKRKDHPFIGQWALPGGFVNVEEDLNNAALRELREETGLENINIEQLYTWGEVDRDPRTRVISCSYISLVDEKHAGINSGDDAQDAAWFDIEYKSIKESKYMSNGAIILESLVEIELQRENSDEKVYSVIEVKRAYKRGIRTEHRTIIGSNGIGFDHGKLIEYGIEYLRDKVESTDMVFSIMPETFTIQKLHEVYKVILGKRIELNSFQSKIKDMVVDVEHHKGNQNQDALKTYAFNMNFEK